MIIRTHLNIIQGSLYELKQKMRLLDELEGLEGYFTVQSVASFLAQIVEKVESIEYYVDLVFGEAIKEK